MRARSLSAFVGVAMAVVALPACGGPRERARAPYVRPSATASPVGSATVEAMASAPPSDSEEPPIVLALPTPTAPSSEASATPAPEDPPPRDPDALVAEQICLDSRQRALDAADRYGIFDSDRRATLADLELEPPRTGDAFLDNVGAGYWGPADVDGDGTEDSVMRFTSVDFWAHFVFLKKGNCLRFAGVLEGWQIEVTRAKGALPRARVFTYPIGPESRVDTYFWNGASFQLRTP